MTLLVPQGTVVDGLAAEFGAIDQLLSGLSDGQWQAPSPCPGWDVHAVVAHIIGTELAISGTPMPPELPDSWSRDHLRNPVGDGNERWIAALAQVSPAELLAQFRDLSVQRIEAIRALSTEAWDAEGFTPVGPDSYGRFMRVRVFDCWMHEQDIRDAVGQPGHDAGVEVDLFLDEVKTTIGYVVGKKAGATEGMSVRFELIGSAPRRVDVLVAGRAQVVDQLPSAATVTLQLPLVLFSRLCGGRVDGTEARRSISVSGDTDLGDRIITNLAYTI